MATQYLNTEKLEDKKLKLENHKTNIVDYLTQIKDEYINLIRNDYWWGPRGDSFFESVKQYWYDFSAPEDNSSSNKGIIGNIENDFNNMIKFIQSAIDLSLGLDVEVAEEIEEAGGGVSGESGEISEPESAPVVVPPVVDESSEEPPIEQSSDSSGETTAPAPNDSGTSMDIPSGDTSFKSYTNIDKLARGTIESAIARGEEYNGVSYNTKTDPETGVRYVTFPGSSEKYYCVAMGTYYGQPGDTLKITTDEGNSFNVILTDVKGSDAASYGNTNLSYYHPKNGSKCVVEFYIDYPADDIKVYRNGDYIGTTGNYNDCERFRGNITSVEKLS